MMYAKIASAAVGLAAVVLLGAGLGNYTVGGVSMHEPVDVIGDAMAHVRNEQFSADSAPQGPIDHICKGCDAGLHRDDPRYVADSAYEADDEWVWEESENRRAVRVALSDDPGAAYRAHPANGEADVVVDKGLVMYGGAAVSHLDQ